MKTGRKTKQEELKQSITVSNPLIAVIQLNEALNMTLILLNYPDESAAYNAVKQNYPVTISIQIVKPSSLILVNNL